MSPEKKAILVVSYGTSYDDTREKTIGAIERHIAERFPDWDVRRAFSSRSVLKILERRGIHVDYVDEALERLADEGYGTVVVQPTLVMNGLEYDFVADAVRRLGGRFERIAMGSPLLTAAEDYKALIDAVDRAYVPLADSMCQRRHALVLMGHGTTHFANSTYSELHLRLALSGHEDVYVTTVEGFPDFADTLRLMEGRGYEEVVLVPIMLVAGDHAVNDLGGDGDDSLRSVMAAAGYEPHCIVRGMGEFPEFRELFCAHAEDAVSRIDGRGGGIIRPSADTRQSCQTR